MATKKEISPEDVVKRITKCLKKMYLDDLVVVATYILEEKYTCGDDALIMIEKSS